MAPEQETEEVGEEQEHWAGHMPAPSLGSNATTTSGHMDNRMLAGDRILTEIFGSLLSHHQLRIGCPHLDVFTRVSTMLGS